MKKIVVLIAFVIVASSYVSAAPLARVKSSSETITDFKIISSSSNGFSAVNTLSDLALNQVQTQSGSFAGIEIPGYSKGISPFGTPELPVMSTLIEIPQKARVRIIIDTMTEELIDVGSKTGSLKILPRQPSLSKNAVKREMPFHLDKTAYSKNGYSEAEKVKVDLLGNMRGVRVGHLTVSPFSYNPARNILKVASRITFRVLFENGDLTETNRLKDRYYSPAFKGAFGKLANYTSPKSAGSKDAILYGLPSSRYPLTYVVVAPSSFLSTTSLKNFIAWKELSGFHVIQANTDDIFYPTSVSNPSDSAKRSYLKTYLQALYDGGTYAPSYVLFVGDVNVIPPWPGNEGNHVTDLYYCTFDSGYLPDAYYGRLPVENTTELNNVINKILPYEAYTMPSGDYLDSCMVIAGADANFGPTYADGQAAYLLNEYLATSGGFSSIYAYLFNNSWAWTGATMASTSSTSLMTSSIIAKINSGVGITNYNGHCGTDGWWNKEYNNGVGAYEFDSTDISSLTANNAYGFYVANCCESSRFELNDSFGEKMVLAQSKGAVCYIGGSNNTFWDEDFFWAVGYRSGIESYTSSQVRNISYDSSHRGAFDALWHTHGESESSWYITAGQMIYMGDLTVANASPDYAQYYFEIYNVLGDPSMMPYLSKPDTIPDPTVHGTISPCSTTTLQVDTLPYSQVALAKTGGTLVASAYSGSTGTVNLSFSPFDSSDQAELTITSQNRQPKTFAVTVNPVPSTQPTAKFMAGTDPNASALTVTSGVPVTFTDLSTGCPASYSWIFSHGTPSTSTATNPLVTFNELGLFDVSLTATNAHGSGSLTKTGYINVVPGVNFAASQTRICYGTTITFTDQSTNSPTAWSWTFQGGTPGSSSLQNPQVLYSTIGTYSVSLTVTINGTPYPITKDAYITVTKLKPVADFTADKTSINAGESVTFTDASANTPTQWNWSFGGGTPATSTSANPTVTFKNGGIYTVVLVATNSGGSNTVSKSNFIKVTGSSQSNTGAIEGSGNGGGCFIGSLK